MKKVIILLAFFMTSKVSSAQYFIPLFQPTIDTMVSCQYLITDTLNNHLLIFSRDNFGNHFMHGYLNNQLLNTNFPFSESVFSGSITESGLGIFYNYSTFELYSVNNLNYSNCFYGECNTDGSDAFVSKNDTIYFDNNIFGDDYVNYLAPSGNVVTIGDAIGGSGISDLEFYNGYLYACGTFTEMNGDTTCKYICYWDGVVWHPLNNLNQLDSVNGIGSLLNYTGKFFMRGGFNQINGIQTEDVASYDGTNWLAHPFLGSIGGIQNWIVFHNRIYLSGILYDTLGNHELFGSYDGTNFNLIPSIPFGPVSSLEVYQDTLYIGGSFSQIKNFIPVKNVAKFVDNSFSSFAPVDTKWWYNSSDNGTSTANSAYTFYYVARDTFIMHSGNYYGYNCRKVNLEQHHANGSVTDMQSLYVFGDTTRIMYFNSYQGKFVPLYKFNVNTGDILTYYTPQPQTISDTTFRVKVDSITQMLIDGSNYKRVWTTPLDGWSFGNDGYVQRVGGLGSFLPRKISEFNNEGPLRCYEDTGTFYQYSTDFACDYINEIEELNNSVSGISVFPNPGNETVTITTENIKELVVSNLLGEVVQSSKYKVQSPSATIDISKLPQGIYLLRVQTTGGWRVGKVVKE